MVKLVLHVFFSKSIRLKSWPVWGAILSVDITKQIGEKSELSSLALITSTERQCTVVTWLVWDYSTAITLLAKELFILGKHHHQSCLRQTQTKLCKSKEDQITSTSSNTEDIFYIALTGRGQTCDCLFSSQLERKFSRTSFIQIFVKASTLDEDRFYRTFLVCQHSTKSRCSWKVLTGGCNLGGSRRPVGVVQVGVGVMIVVMSVSAAAMMVTSVRWRRRPVVWRWAGTNEVQAEEWLHATNSDVN